ncbi:hypothetical protein NSQ20_12370 [Paenibacillus sp. FSL K6-1122]|uniref:hypothetical protein n=1 Tax=Paenibacillus sp. FSL K6-1122 TaxID=2954512 RepID=UPI0030EBB51A
MTNEEIIIDKLWDRYYDLKDVIETYERRIEEVEEDLDEVKKELEDLGEAV